MSKREETNPRGSPKKPNAGIMGKRLSMSTAVNLPPNPNVSISGSILVSPRRGSRSSSTSSTSSKPVQRLSRTQTEKGDASMPRKDIEPFFTPRVNKALARDPPIEQNTKDDHDGKLKRVDLEDEAVSVLDGVDSRSNSKEPGEGARKVRRSSSHTAELEIPPTLPTQHYGPRDAPHSQNFTQAVEKVALHSNKRHLKFMCDAKKMVPDGSLGLVPMEGREEFVFLDPYDRHQELKPIWKSKESLAPLVPPVVRRRPIPRLQSAPAGRNYRSMPHSGGWSHPFHSASSSPYASHSFPYGQDASPLHSRGLPHLLPPTGAATYSPSSAFPLGLSNPYPLPPSYYSFPTPWAPQQPFDSPQYVMVGKDGIGSGSIVMLNGEVFYTSGRVAPGVYLSLPLSDPARPQYSSGEVGCSYSPLLPVSGRTPPLLPAHPSDPLVADLQATVHKLRGDIHRHLAASSILDSPHLGSPLSPTEDVLEVVRALLQASDTPTGSDNNVGGMPVDVLKDSPSQGLLNPLDKFSLSTPGKPLSSLGSNKGSGSFKNAPTPLSPKSGKTTVLVSPVKNMSPKAAKSGS